jgi:ankyrin repeat protein
LAGVFLRKGIKMTELLWAAKRGDLAAVYAELAAGAAMADTGDDYLEVGWTALTHGAASTNCSEAVFAELVDRALAAGEFHGNPATGYALHAAAKTGAIGKVRTLLAAGADPTMKASLGAHMLDMLIYHRTPDHVASFTAILEALSPGDVDLGVLAMVVRQGTGRGNRKALQAVIEYGGSSLRQHLAEKMGWVVAGIALGEGLAALDLAELDDRQSALKMAVSLDELEVAKELVARGADAKEPYDFSTPAIRNNIAGGDFGPTVTPYLSVAAEGDAVECLAWLLELGADANEPGFANWTPLHQAASHGCARATHLLLQAGASLEWAEGSIITDAAGAAIPVLLDAGADIDAIGEDGNWLLITAVETGDLQLARDLLDRGAKVDNHSEYIEITALHKALDFEEAHIALLLLERGADPNNCDLDGERPLDCARSNFLREKLLAVGAKRGWREGD